MGHRRPTIHLTVHCVGAIAALAFVLSFLIHNAGMAVSLSGPDAASVAGPTTVGPRVDSDDPAAHGEPARDCHEQGHKAEAVGRDRTDCPDVMGNAPSTPIPTREASMREPLPALPRSPLQIRILFQVFLN